MRWKVKRGEKNKIEIRRGGRERDGEEMDGEQKAKGEGRFRKEGNMKGDG